MKDLNFRYERNGPTRHESLALERLHTAEAKAAFRDRDYATTHKLMDTAEHVKIVRKRQAMAPSDDFGEPAIKPNADTSRIVTGTTAAERLGITPKRGNFWQ